MGKTFLNILSGTLPTVIISSVIAVTLRVVYLLKYRKKFHFFQELLSLSFIVYIICLFYAVTFQDIDGTFGTANFTPFQEMFRYTFGSRLFIKNVLGNMLMFVPYGFFTSYFLKEKNIFVNLFLTLVLSLTIEFTQSQIGRVFDVDDVILNLVGGIDRICSLPDFCLFRYFIYEEEGRGITSSFPCQIGNI